MRRSSGRATPGRSALALALLATLASPAMAGEAEAPAVEEACRAALARGDAGALRRVVAGDRAGAYEAADRMFLSFDPGRARLGEAIAGAYAEIFGDRSLVERARVVGRWTGDERRRREEAMAWKNDAIARFREGRNAEALLGFKKALDVFRDLGDLREAGKCLSNLGAIGAMEGDRPAALENLAAAHQTVRRAGDRPQLATVLLNRAYLLEDMGDLEGTVAALAEGLAIARETGDVELEGRFLVNGGALAFRMGRLEEASASYREAADLARDGEDWELLSIIRLNLAAVDSRRADPEAERRDLKQSLAAARRGRLPRNETDALLGLAKQARVLADLDEARRLIGEARAVALTMDDRKFRALVDYEEASVLVADGQYARAIPLLDAAAENLAETDAEGTLSSVIGDRSVALYYLGAYGEAVETLRRAIERTVAAAQPHLEALHRDRLGFLLATLGDPAGGLTELEAAAAGYRATGDVTGTGHALDAIGWLRFRSGDRAGARAALEEALTLLPAEASPIDRAETEKDLAMVEMDSGAERRDRAVELLRRARETFATSNDLEGSAHAGLLEAETALAAGSVPEARVALERAARAAKGRRSSEFAWAIEHARARIALAGGDARAAEGYLRRSIAEVERLRDSVRPPAWRAAVLEDRIEPYRALAGLLRRAGDVEGAYRVARRAKARTFVESLVPPEFGAGPRAPGGADRALLTDEVHRSSKLRSLLGDREVLLDFFFDDRDLVAFVLRREGLAARVITVDRAELSGLLESARVPGRPGPAERAVTAVWTRAMNRLGELLLGPLAADLDAAVDLLVVPGSALNGLPFAALAYRGRPLIETHTLALLPAMETLQSRRRLPARTGDLLVVGDPAADDPLGRLPGAAAEARLVASQFERQALVAIGPTATEALVRARAPAADLIHLAAHGRADPLAPGRSYIALAPGDGSDGRLEASEIAALSLRASLVVLSGCSTAVEGGLARGDPRSDERMGLARAFLQSGAASVVAGLWEVEDGAGSVVMSAFYPELRTRSPAAALAALQRKLIAGKIRADRGREFEHPFYWAGLVVYGAGTEGPERTVLAGKR